MKSAVNCFVLIRCMSSPDGHDAFCCCSQYAANNDNRSSLNINKIFKHCQDAVDEELKDMTSVLFELIRVCDGCFNLDFDGNMVDFIC